MVAMIKNVNKNIRLLLIFKILLLSVIVKIKRPFNLYNVEENNVKYSNCRSLS